MRLRPSRLPRVRDQVVRYITDPDVSLRRASALPVEEWDRLARALTVADLYWTAPDMAALAVHAAETLPEVRWTVADRPAPAGLIVWDGGIGRLPATAPPEPSRSGKRSVADLLEDSDVPVDAASWGPAPQGLCVWLWIARSRLPDIDADTTPPLLPLVSEPLPVTDAPTPVEELNPLLRTILTSLAATWHLMQQPLLVDHDRVEVDRDIRRAYGRAQRPAPEVTLVDLRRGYAPTDQAPDDSGSGRRYRHRWVVAGHWRNQAHGPGRSLRRRTWIPDYIKGPDGAPLLATTKVNVWRR